MTSYSAAVIEKICDRRILNENVEYLVKWKELTEDANTWELAENLDCQDLIQQYEDAQKKDEQPSTSGCSSKAGRKRNAEVNGAAGPSDSKKRRDSTSKSDNELASDVPSRNRRHLDSYGFERGWEVEKIISVADSGGGLVFLIKFKDIDGEKLVPASVANIHIPQQIIKFYEERIRFYDD